MTSKIADFFFGKEDDWRSVIGKRVVYAQGTLLPDMWAFLDDSLVTGKVENLIDGKAVLIEDIWHPIESIKLYGCVPI